MRWYILATSLVLCHLAVCQEEEPVEPQQDQPVSENQDDVSTDEAKEIAPRAIGEPSIQDGKFNIYVGTIDGVRRIVFNEVDGGQDNVPPDNSIGRDPFGAYDDNQIINQENEKSIFVPKPYRPGSKDETSTQKPTTRPPPPPPPPPPPRAPQPLPPIRRPQPPPPVSSPRAHIPDHRVPQPRPQQPQLPPQAPPPDTSPARPPPFQGDGLRSGVCHNSIFYISTPINGPTRLTFTHFAIAVTVDQCARTCHEFNCAIAHYNPINGHCEFNPSTALAIRNGQCPAWPSLHYRNNVVASEPVRIFCVTCQKPRRRINRSRTRNVRRPSRQGIFSQDTPVVHGVPLNLPSSFDSDISEQIAP